MPVEPSSAICESCGKFLEGEAQGKHCTSCETLISAKSSSCPICGEKFTSRDGIIEPEKPLNHEEEAMISQLLTWTKAREPSSIVDTAEDKKEREHALHVLRSLTVGDSEEAVSDRIERIEKPKEKKDDAETRGKQLVKVGKPFEATLEQNMINLNQTEFELSEKRAKLRLLEGKTDIGSLESKRKLEIEIKELRDKKQSLISYQSDILMMGGAYRKLLKEQQSELLKIEAELKKRVEAFRKELDRRKKQKERLRKREEALDKREEDLSHRFLDLKKRSNEVLSTEETLKKRHEELKVKEESVIRWEEEIAASREADTRANVGGVGNPALTKQEWLEEHKRLQADLVMVRTGVIDDEKRKQGNILDNKDQELVNTLKERENELDNRRKELEELKTMIMEKDKEIEKLKANVSESAIEEDTRKILQILDDLLEKLPEEIVDKFAKSNDYLLYEKVLDAYKI
jgi:hypothetical protein